MMAVRSVFDAELTTFAERPLAVSLPDEWVPVRAVAERLGLTQSLAMQLMVSELAGALSVGAQDPASDRIGDSSCAPPWVIRSGSRLLMPRRGLKLLASIPHVEGAPGRYINVRLGPGTRSVVPEDRTQRPYLGFHRTFTERERYDAATRWWFFRDAEEWIGAPFVASIAGFVTLAGRIEAVADCPWMDAVGFTVDTTDADIGGVFSDRRIPVHPGGPALKITDGK